MLVKMRERNEGRKDSIHHEGHEGHEVSKSGKGTGYFFSNSTKKIVSPPLCFLFCALCEIQAPSQEFILSSSTPLRVNSAEALRASFLVKFLLPFVSFVVRSNALHKRG